MKHAQATGLVIAILIAAAAAGFGVYQWLQPMPHSTATSMLPAAPPQNVPAALSANRALALSLDDLSGNPHSLADWHGKVLLVNFWATWCPPCREEVPLLVKLQAKYAARGLQVVGIATDEQSEQDVRAFVKKMVVNYPILMSDNQSAQIISALGGTFIGLPVSILLDPDGKVLKIHSGELEPNEAESLVRTALKLPNAPPLMSIATTQSN
ncbi:MAG: TlpA disulfide reductase family protein [Gammaproteobacteria bacterium]